MGNISGERSADRVIRPSPGFSITVWPGRLELQSLGGKAIDRRALEVIRTFAVGRHRTIEDAAEAATGDPSDDEFLGLARGLLIWGGLRRVASSEEVDDPPRPGATAATGDERVPGDVHVRLASPLSVRPRRGRFEIVGHDGSRSVDLSLDEVLVLPRLASGGPVAAPSGPEDARDGGGAAPPVDVEHLCARLVRARLLVTIDPATRHVPAVAPNDARARRRAAFAAAAARDARGEQERERRTGERRTAVVPVSFTNGPPLALGLIFAHCTADQDRRLTDRYDFRCDWEWDDDRLATYTERPAIYLCSTYVWSHVQVLGVVRAVKERSPHSLVVIGGPDAPKREVDARRYFEDHPEVDVIVRGEGEQTALELLDAVARRADGGFDRTDLAAVPGVTFRLDGAVVRTPDRDRLTDLDVLPSPFLTGLFDTYLDAPLDQVIIETNRGCPYGCTFCDWGSATQSRIRQFALDRVFGEIDWSARAQAAVVSFADANFGIFARDVEIAEHVTAVRAETSFPVGFGANFAKNTVKHLGPIIRTLVEGGIVNRGLLALQTMDEETLDTIERSNIKVERYDAIAAEMRAAGLPFAVELMMGLPGATVESFTRDLQQCIDREVEGTVNPTSVLLNSPMNAPAYRAEHRIETAVEIGPGNHALVVSTATFTRDDYQRMSAIRRAFLAAENFGVTRHVDRLIRHATGTREIDVIQRLLAEVVDDAGGAARHPFLRSFFGQPSPTLVIPVSWQLFVDDLAAYVREAYPTIDPGELATVARVQHAMLPAFDRPYPEVIELEHDYVSWFSLVVEAKEQGHRDDWTQLVPPLRSFGPGALRVDDPSGSARRNIGCSVDHGPLLASWEHDSAIGRSLFLAATPT